jgi:hypothetical protein
LRRFVDDLLAQHPQWSQPLFSERSSGDGTSWHRLLAGAFRDRSDARTWFLEGRGRWNFDYGQVELLSPRAEMMTFLLEAGGGLSETTGAGG